MVVPEFDLLRVLGGVPCPTCNDNRMVFVTNTVSSSRFTMEEDRVREKLYGEYEWEAKK